MNCTKMEYKKFNGYEHITEIFEFSKFQQLLKHILTVFSSLGGLVQCLWVRKKKEKSPSIIVNPCSYILTLMSVTIISAVEYCVLMSEAAIPMSNGVSIGAVNLFST